MLDGKESKVLNRTFYGMDKDGVNWWARLIGTKGLVPSQQALVDNQEKKMNKTIIKKGDDFEVKQDKDGYDVHVLSECGIMLDEEQMEDLKEKGYTFPVVEGKMYLQSPIKECPGLDVYPEEDGPIDWGHNPLKDAFHADKEEEDEKIKQATLAGRAANSTKATGELLRIALEPMLYGKFKLEAKQENGMYNLVIDGKARDIPDREFKTRGPASRLKDTDGLECLVEINNRFKDGK
jgi:hypothetical protein